MIWNHTLNWYKFISTSPISIKKRYHYIFNLSVFFKSNDFSRVDFGFKYNHETRFRTNLAMQHVYETLVIILFYIQFL